MPPAEKRPRRSPASLPLDPTTGAAAGPAALSSSKQRFRDVLARKQSAACMLGSLRAMCTALEAEVGILAQEEITLRAEVAADHNRTQSCLVKLPTEVRQMVLGRLSIQALGRLAATSKDWQHSIADPVIWHAKARAAGAKCLCQLLDRGAVMGAELTTICCHRVWEISNAGRGATNAEALTFCRLGGPRAMVGAMRSHAADAGLQAQACHTLMVLCRGDVGKEAVVVLADGVGAVVEAMRAH
eukprot:SAG25_NODE_3391_length_1099_cov_19.447412_1_plen_242_part_01